MKSGKHTLQNTHRSEQGSANHSHYESSKEHYHGHHKYGNIQHRDHYQHHQYHDKQHDGAAVTKLIPGPSITDTKGSPELGGGMMGEKAALSTDSEDQTLAPSVLPSNAVQFLFLLGEILRLPLNTVCIALVFAHKYHAFTISAGQLAERAEQQYPELIDEYSLSITCLSLATKSTESPRRLRELLVPAYHLLHGSSAPRLTFPSHAYDALRAGIVHFELVLLRILDYDTGIRTALSSNFSLLERTLDRGISAHVYGVNDLADIIRGSMQEGSTTTISAAKQDQEYANEFGIVCLHSTAIGRTATDWILVCYQREEIALSFKPAAIAAASTYMAILRRGYAFGCSMEAWVCRVTCNGLDKLEDETVEDENSEDLKQQIIDLISKLRTLPFN
ncbi:hypothetical protein POJ06DRAFT_76094 [Lipomyces tetrasporus]|uniref:Cyclin N-terminal domain-containing protein n=1 Tax=Lipomyces tetrasporus TaxID=54092 RepID=A0AAD7VTF7_9ASCO|nr:uncharacterized protein POJ06DRAFT_76094 [Lipomyces tetrasporus]KAJ8102052.1 hypothetical protein POJ06DRAFT_76094 [Lipomyces tetrasporus]